MGKSRKDVQGSEERRGKRSGGERSARISRFPQGVDLLPAQTKVNRTGLGKHADRSQGGTFRRETKKEE